MTPTPVFTSTSFKTFDPPVPAWIIEGYSLREIQLDAVSPKWIWIHGRRGSACYKIRNPGSFSTRAEAEHKLRRNFDFAEKLHLEDLERIRVARAALSSTNTSNDNTP